MTPSLVGPLAGLKVVEFGGVGPAPFGTMLLADMGADVVRVERPDTSGDMPARFPPDLRVLGRGVRSIVLDLKSASGCEAAERLIARSDVLVEGFRPGVMERLGFGPDVASRLNERLIFARMTGWGQDGPRAHHAGHDINYIAASGVLASVGSADGAPVPPANLLGDFGGGGMLLVVGVLAAVLEARGSGRGQVLDVNMLDGTALLTAVLHEWRSAGRWHDGHGTNFIDSGSPFYNVYPLADGSWLAIGAIERKFWAALMAELGFNDKLMLNCAHDESAWSEIRNRLAARVVELTPSEVDALEANPEACATRVIPLSGVAAQSHNRQRDVITDVGGVASPSPAPRFSRTTLAAPKPARALGADTVDVLRELGLDRGNALNEHQSVEEPS